MVARRGLVMLSALVVLGLAGVMLAAFFSVLQIELNAGMRATGRIQALYLAEAGLSAAHDALAQDWSRLAAGPLRLREAVSVPMEQGSLLIGDYEVVALPLSPTAARLVAVGRAGMAGGGVAQHGIVRSLVAVVVARIRPSFSRLGSFGILDIAVEYGDNGLPWTVAFSGRLKSESGSTGFGHVLTSWDRALDPAGLDLTAGFHDVDGDGDQDLLLASTAAAADAAQKSFLPTRALTAQEQQQMAVTATSVDLFGTGALIPVVTSGWLVVPDGQLTRSGAGVDVFINTPARDDTSMVSWSEVAPERAAAILSEESSRLTPTPGGRYGTPSLL
jgi:hypothetical protein